MKLSFILPLHVDIPRSRSKDRRVYLNLNVYRNLHHMVNNIVKSMFAPIFIEGFTVCQRIRVSYTVKKKRARKYDLMNVISIVDKYFLDWLVDNEYIPDDNIDHVEYGSITAMYGHDSDCCVAVVEILE